MLTGVSNDLPTTLQCLVSVAVSVRYTKHPVTREPGLKRHTSPVGDEVLTEIPKTPNNYSMYTYCSYVSTYMGQFG